jgi:hypothetical protein
MKHLRLFENFEIVDPIKYGEPLNNKEINFLKGYNIMCPEFILKDDNYYYVHDHRCENIKDLPLTYIHGVCSKFKIGKYKINDDHTINVTGDVYIKNVSLTKIPLVFNIVSGVFNCYGNKLTTLEGSPRSVDHFSCTSNKLTTLEGGPEYVSGNFFCSDNKLTTLKGSPKSVGGNFYCGDNKLTTLEGSPKSVGGNFACDDNKLTTLKGSPKSVGHFDCRKNQLTTLEGGPTSVGDNFYCGDNKLTTLKGSPKSVGGNLYCSGNPLKSLKYKGIIKGNIIYN